MEKLGYVLLSGLVLALFILGYLSGIGTGTQTLTATGERGFGDDTEYYPSNDTVRIVTQRSGGEIKQTREVPLQEYAGWQCGEVALNRYRDWFARRYGDTPPGVSSGLGTDEISVSAIIDPRVHPDYFELERHAPEQITVNLSYPNGSRTCTVPVDVELKLDRPKPG